MLKHKLHKSQRKVEFYLWTGEGYLERRGLYWVGEEKKWIQIWPYWVGVPVRCLHKNGQAMQSLDCSSEIQAGKRNVDIIIILCMGANQEKEMSALSEGILE